MPSHNVYSKGLFSLRNKEQALKCVKEQGAINPVVMVQTFPLKSLMVLWSDNSPIKYYCFILTV